MADVSEQIILVTARDRGATGPDPRLPDPPAEALAALVTPAARVVLAGGEPTLRGDLPEVVAAVAAVAPPLLRTDGLALGQAAALRPLLGAGLAGVRLELHSGRRRAHDWLAGRRGATRAAIRAIRACVASGLRVEVEATATRATIGHLAETVALVAHLGVTTVRIRMPRPGEIAADHRVARLPRVGLLREPLQSAARVDDVEVELEGFPRCCLGEAEDRLRPTDGSVITAVAGWESVAARRTTPPAASRCAACPGPPDCPGLSVGYTHLFGSGELDLDSEPAA